MMPTDPIKLPIKLVSEHNNRKQSIYMACVSAVIAVVSYYCASLLPETFSGHLSHDLKITLVSVHGRGYGDILFYYKNTYINFVCLTALLIMGFTAPHALRLSRPQKIVISRNGITVSPRSLIGPPKPEKIYSIFQFKKLLVEIEHEGDSLEYCLMLIGKEAKDNIVLKLPTTIRLKDIEKIKLYADRIGAAINLPVEMTNHDA